MSTNLSNANQSSIEMTSIGSAIYQVESFLDEFFRFRRNIVSGKSEYMVNPENEEDKPIWKVFTSEAFNSIVRKAKKLGIGGKKSPRQDIEEYIHSEDIPEFDPIKEYLEHLPKWDGQNHVAALRQNTGHHERATELALHLASLLSGPLAPDGHAAWQ